MTFQPAVEKPAAALVDRVRRICLHTGELGRLRLHEVDAVQLAVQDAGREGPRTDRTRAEDRAAIEVHLRRSDLTL